MKTCVKPERWGIMICYPSKPKSKQKWRGRLLQVGAGGVSPAGVDPTPPRDASLSYSIGVGPRASSREGEAASRAK